MRKLFLALAWLVFGLAIAVAWLARPTDPANEVFLLGGQRFMEDFLRDAEAAFAEADLTDYRLEGGRVIVPKDQDARYLAALAEHQKLPPGFGAALESKLQRDIPFDDPKARQDCLTVARQKELSRIIRSMSGIEHAAVLYDASPVGIGSEETIITAAVSVKCHGTCCTTYQQRLAIRQLLVAAIAGLKSKYIEITDCNGAVHTGEDDTP